MGEFLTGRQKNFTSWRKGALASALALGVGAACFAAGRGSVTATVTDVEQKYFIDTIPPMDQCMADSKDCSKAKCCKTAGHVCYEKDAGYASCMKEGMCTKGTCKVLKPSWAQSPQKTTSSNCCRGRPSWAQASLPAPPGRY